MNKYKFQIVGSDKTKKAFASVGKNIKKVAADTIKAGAAISSALALGGGALVASTLSANTEMIRLAESTGVSTTALSEWGHAAGTVNLSTEKMADIFKDVQDKIGDFAITGGGGAVDMFENMNLKLEDLIALSPDQQLLKIGEALENVGTQSEKIFFMEALAGDASLLLPLLDNGAEKLKNLQDEAREFGLSISELDAAKMKAAERSIERVGSLYKGFSNTLTKEVAPILEVVAERFVGAVGGTKDLSAAVRKGFSGAGRIVGVFADGIHGLRVIFKGLELTARLVVMKISEAFDVFRFGSLQEIARAIGDFLVAPLRNVLEILAPFNEQAQNALNGLSGFMDGFLGKGKEQLNDFAQAQRDAFESTSLEIQTLLTQKLPSDVITQNIEGIMNEADEKIKDKIKQIKSENAVEPIESPSSNVALLAKIERIKESHLTELELIQAKEDQELALLQESQQKKAINYQQFLELKFKSEQKFDKQRKKLAERNLKDQAALTNAANTIAKVGGEKGAKIAQAINLKTTIMDTHTGAMSAYKSLAGIPYIGPALGAAAYATVWAQGIKSQKGVKSISASGGGASTPSTSGTGSPAISDSIGKLNLNESNSNNNQGSPIAPVINFSISGDLNSNDASTFLSDVKNLITGGDFVLIEPDSRNGQELAGAT